MATLFIPYYGGVIMTKLRLLLDEIEEQRTDLLRLIEDKNSFTDEKVIEANKKLNYTIVKYQNLCMKNKSNILQF